MTDARLIQIVDAAWSDAVARGGGHLACHAGCAQCCLGVFAINALDVERLRRGYRALSLAEPERFARVRRRVGDFVTRMAASYPGDPVTGFLDDSDQGRLRFADFADDEPCPVLDPRDRTCDLYDHRPMTCRVFGPPVRSDAGGGAAALSLCELCFVGATEEQIAAGEMTPDPDNLEDHLLQERLAAGATPRTTIVAYALFTPSIARAVEGTAEEGKGQGE